MKTSRTPRSLLVLCMAILTLASCSKDSEIPISSSDAYLVSEIWSNNELLSTLEYDNENLLSTLTMYNEGAIIGITKYSYNEKHHLVQTRTQNIKGEEEWRDTYQYNNGKLISGETYVYGVLRSEHSFTHTHNKTTKLSRSSEGLTVVNAYTYNDQGNIILFEYTDQNGSWKMEWSDFDDKKAFGPSIDLLSSINNPRYQKTSNHPNAATNIEVLYKFTYNEAGYVTSVELINKGTSKVIEKTTFKLIPIE